MFGVWLWPCLILGMCLCLVKIGGGIGWIIHMLLSKNQKSQNCLERSNCLKRSSFRPKILFCPSCGCILEYKYNSRGWLCFTCVNNECNKFLRLIKLGRIKLCPSTNVGFAIRNKGYKSRTKKSGVCLQWAS